MSNIAPFSATLGTHLIATVADAANGQAVTITTIAQQELAVAGHASNTPILNIGDTVIAVNIEGDIFIIDRLRSESERPFLSHHEGRVTLQAETSIALTVQDQALSINNAGDIKLQANNVSVCAEDLNEIKGKLVTIN